MVDFSDANDPAYYRRVRIGALLGTHVVPYLGTVKLAKLSGLDLFGGAGDRRHVQAAIVAAMASLRAPCAGGRGVVEVGHA